MKKVERGEGGGGGQDYPGGKADFSNATEGAGGLNKEVKEEDHGERQGGRGSGKEGCSPCPLHYHWPIVRGLKKTAHEMRMEKNCLVVMMVAKERAPYCLMVKLMKICAVPAETLSAAISHMK